MEVPLLFMIMVATWELDYMKFLKFTSTHGLRAPRVPRARWDLVLSMSERLGRYPNHDSE